MARRRVKAADKVRFGWFLAGVGIGAAVAVLYAPKSGLETREDVASATRDSSEYVKQRSRQAADKVSDMADRGRDQLHDYIDRGKDAVDQGRQTVSDQVDKVNRAVKGVKRAYQNTSSGDPKGQIASAIEPG